MRLEQAQHLPGEGRIVRGALIEKHATFGRGDGRGSIKQVFDFAPALRVHSLRALDSRAQRPDEPGSGELPVALNSGIGRFERAGHLLVGHPGKELHFHHLGFARVDFA